MIKKPIELIQERIDSIKKEVEKRESQPGHGYHLTYLRREVERLNNELNFLDGLRESLEEYVTLPLAKDHILSILWEIVKQLELDQQLGIAYAGKLGVNQASMEYKDKALRSARNLIQIVENDYLEEFNNE